MAVAQVTPDAGSLLNQIQRSFPAPRLPEVGPPPPPPKVELLAPKGATLSVSSFTFEGNTLVPSTQLSAMLQGYLGRALTFDDLRNAAAEVSLHYRSQGYVATVSIPKQEVKDGVVVLRILESRFGAVVFDGVSDGRIRPGLIQGMIFRALPSGAPTDMRALDRGLLLVGDLPGASVVGGLAAGTEEGRSDLVVVSHATPLVVGSLNVDNAGSRSTGEARALASLSLNSPFGSGDQLSVDLLKSEGARYGRLAFGVPAGLDGGKLSLGANRMDYELVSPEFLAARLSGRSSGWNADYSRALTRSRVFNVYFTAGFDAKDYLNLAAGTRTSDYRVRSGSLGFNFNVYDGWGGGGITNGQLQWTLGDLDLAGSPNQAAVASTTRAEGRFQKLRLSLSRTQNLAETVSLMASVNGQLASKNLDTSEKLFAGGVGGVRAYPTSEGSGDAGYVATLETRWQFASRWQVSAFVDQAQLKVNEDNAFSGAATDNHPTYRGAGVGLSWQGPVNSVWRATWSRRSGANPNPKPNGSDQDGTLTLDRVWLSAAFQF